MGSDRRRKRRALWCELEARATVGDVLALTWLQHLRAERAERRARAEAMARAGRFMSAAELAAVPLVPAFAQPAEAVLIELPGKREAFPRPAKRPVRQLYGRIPRADGQETLSTQLPRSALRRGTYDERWS